MKLLYIFDKSSSTGDAKQEGSRCAQRSEHSGILLAAGPVLKKIRLIKLFFCSAAIVSPICLAADYAATPSPWSCQPNAQGTWVCSEETIISPAPATVTPAIVAPVVPTTPANPLAPVIAAPVTDTSTAVAEITELGELDWVSIEQISDSSIKQSIKPQCTGAYVEPYIEVLDADLPTAEAPIHASAASTQYDEKAGKTYLEGGVRVQQQDRFIESKQAVIDNAANTAELRKQVKVREPGLLITGTAATVNFTQQTTQMKNVRYVIHDARATGSAEEIERQADGIIRMEDATYTTCEPGDKSWELVGNNIQLNRDTGFGKATHVTIKMHEVPVFYSPLLYFPITDKRRSGFLFPSAGLDTEDGVTLATPYYFNLAPNYDATLTPRYIEERGILMENEVRYLGSHQAGKLGASYLGSDNLTDNEDRSLLTWKHKSQPARNWRTNTDINYVSDNDYFADLESDLEVNAQTHLDRYTQANYTSDHWDFLGRVQSFQTIDDDIRDANLPYFRLPQLKLSALYPQATTGLEYQFDSEYVFFDRAVDSEDLSAAEIANGAEISGNRVHTAAGVSWPFQRPEGFFTPAAKLKHTGYWLNDQVANQPDSPEVTLPVFSLDGGLFFERPFKFFDSNYQQTLEPRFYYLNIPFEDQTNDPTFDSSNLTFSYSQLFRDDRFSGNDRIGDANQLSTGVTSRFLKDSTGEERVRLSLGEIFFYEDRRVTLPGGLVDKTTESLTAGEAAYALNNAWRIVSDMLWNSHTSTTEQSSVRLSYKPQDDRIFNISHRYRRKALDQSDISFIWPLVSRWSVIGQWRNSYIEDRTLESLIGVEYNTCCWRLRLGHHHIVISTDDNDDPNGLKSKTGLFLQLQLKGLAGFGDNASSLLSENIPGFKERDDDEI